jgi:peptidase E
MTETQKLNIIAIGGGRIYAGETKDIDKYVCSRLPADNKTIAVLPTASKDHPEYITSIKNVYEGLGAKVVVMYEKDLVDGKLSEILTQSGGLYIGGGDVNYLSQKLTETNSLDAVANFARVGKLVAGLSAGCALLFEKTIFLEKETPSVFDGVGIIDDVVLPHFEQNLLKKCKDDISAELKKNKNIFGISNGCAMHFSDRKEYVVIKESYSQGLWQISDKSGSMHAEPIG